jgi:hypothetical protein
MHPAPRILFGRLSLAVLVTGALAAGASMQAPPDSDRPPNTLTAEERAAGWRLLFDGRTLEGWRGYKRDAPQGWAVEDGTIARTGPGGDIMTVEQFGSFELALEWKISPGGNSGIFYRGTEQGVHIWESAPEMQVLDNTKHPDGKTAVTSAGANYGLHPPARDVTRPVGEWNQVRLVVNGPHVEHWLNGVKVVEYEQWSPEWEALVKASKFSTMPSYGRARQGHLALQDHGDPVWFRSIRIRPL